MTDTPAPPMGTTAGALLRAAREKQGLHIAALAAAIKVTPRKLEALERDRYDELPDATFTRALAQTVCRSLKIDPTPVLALLPHAEAPALDHVTGTLNAPFRDRPGREDPSALAVAAIRPMAWAGVALLLAAVVVYLLPSSLWNSAPATRAPVVVVAASAAVAAAPVVEPAASAPTAEASASAPLFPPPAAADSAVAAAPPAAASAAPTPPPAPVVVAPAPAPAPMAVAASAPRAASVAAGTLLQLRAEAPSWVEVRDARGSVLLSRVVQTGENVGLDGALPIKLTIGNASGTRLSFRGKALDLAASTRDNVARLELQ